MRQLKLFFVKNKKIKIMIMNTSRLKLTAMLKAEMLSTPKIVNIWNFPYLSRFHSHLEVQVEFSILKFKLSFPHSKEYTRLEITGKEILNQLRNHAIQRFISIVETRPAY